MDSLPLLPSVVILPPSAAACNAAANSNMIFMPNAANLNMIFMTDSLSGKIFLADSGASLSIMPNKSAKGPKVTSVNGAICWGLQNCSYQNQPLQICSLVFTG